MENPPCWWYLPGKMVIFMGYVGFREGICFYCRDGVPESPEVFLWLSNRVQSNVPYGRSVADPRVDKHPTGVGKLDDGRQHLSFLLISTTVSLVWACCILVSLFLSRCKQSVMHISCFKTGGVQERQPTVQHVRLLVEGFPQYIVP